MTRFYSRLFLILLINIAAMGSLVSCSLFHQDQQDELDDPIARAALPLRPGAYEMSEEGRMQAQQELRQIQSAANSGEVALGMAMNDVLRAWGEPANVETAGDSTQGNQRWTYYHGLTGRYSMNNSARIVYFEDGRVVGWQMR